MTDIRMIVTDLDRTLLHSDKTISAYSAGILQQCQVRGIMIAIATVRSERSCRRFTEMIGPDAVISNGGALVRLGSEVIYRCAMTSDVASLLLQNLLQAPGVGYITVDTETGYLVNQPVDENDPAWTDYLPARSVDFSLGISCAAYKITAEIADVTIARQIADSVPAVGVTPFAGERWYRFADKTAGKWNGLLAILGRTGLDRKNIVAFGDDYSDIELLKGCGAGIAVANAIDEVQAVADQVCDTNDRDGVAHWIEENIL